ncbi:MAG: signal recognition particle-docking protein FtsY [Henriciella sp.]|nr:signal recognition particle-docking protein FtsY [Henriciella sp.]
MILWFGKKKKKEEALKAGAEMEAPELSAEELAAQKAAEEEAERLAAEEAARLAAEKEEIERKVAEANRAWEERQKREAAEAEAAAQRLAEENARRAEAEAEARRQAEAARLQAEAEARAAEEAARAQAEAERLAAEAEAKAAADAEAARQAEAARAEADRLRAEADAKRLADEAAAEAARKAEEDAKRVAEEAEAARVAEEERRAAQEKAAAELALLEKRREDEKLRAELAAKEAERQAAIARGEPDPYAEVRDPGFFTKISTGLAKSSSKMGESITGLFTKRKLDDEALEDLEDLLLTSDMGGKVAAKVAANIAKSRYEKDVTDEEIKIALADEIEAIMTPREEIVDFSEGSRPRVVLFVGVNGSGKTTTIGKIASKLKDQGAKALLVAGDTFRAAAIEQLTVWGQRAGIPVLSKETGADAAGLVYEAIEKAKAEDLDLVLVDTAGRLQNKAELMAELSKIVRVTRKLDPDAPHDVILVLDATVGQNALSQVEAFRHTADVTGIVMTKLDGTAKGGVLVAIAEAHALPIHFVGVGEKAEDLQPFSARAYARALVGLSDIAAEPETEPA